MTEITRAEHAEKDLGVFRKEVSAWLDANIPPNPDFILPDSFMEVGTDEQFEYLKAWQQSVYVAGYLGMAWPKEYGGGGMPQVYQDIVNQEMAFHKAPFVPNTIGLNWAGPLILHMGSESDKKKYLKGILSCEDVWCQGFSEPDHGSDLGMAQTRAVREGDEFVLNGSKIWSTLATQAKYMILLARTSTGGKSKYEGLSFFLSPMGVEGIDTQPIKKLTGEYGFCQTFFTDAHISDSCLIGNEGEGWGVAMATLMFERGASGGQAGGLSFMDVGVNDVVELARRAMRNGKPAIEDPLIRDELVQMVIESQGNSCAHSRAAIPALNTERPTSVMMSGKLRVTELKRRMTKLAISLQGANGGRYISDSAIDGGRWQRAYFNSFSATIGGGTSQIQANIIGERVLGLAKS